MTEHFAKLIATLYGRASGQAGLPGLNRKAPLRGNPMRRFELPLLGLQLKAAPWGQPGLSWPR